MKQSILWQKIVSFAVERYLRIHTTGHVGPVSLGGTHYTPLPYQIIFKILAHLKMGPDEVFMDIGCGKGRVVCCACRIAIRRVVALEVNEPLLHIAMDNVRRVRGRRAEVEPAAMLAELYDYRDTTVIYLYNPFDESVLRKVLQNINASFMQRPRRLRIVYANCLYESPLKELGWMERYDEWTASTFPGFACPISFWRSCSS